MISLFDAFIAFSVPGPRYSYSVNSGCGRCRYQPRLRQLDDKATAFQLVLGAMFIGGSPESAHVNIAAALRLLDHLGGRAPLLFDVRLYDLCGQACRQLAVLAAF